MTAFMYTMHLMDTYLNHKKPVIIKFKLTQLWLKLIYK